MRAIYRLVTLLMGPGMWLLARWNTKIRKGWEGRKTQKSAWQNAPHLHGCTWFHCASLGEFEQARPVLEALHEQSPQTPILLTFFSPSGFEIRYDYNRATEVWYLPLDTKANAQAFIEGVKPAKALFVKYEVWPHFFAALAERDIPLILFSAIFRPSQRYFQWYGGLFRSALQSCTAVFVQDKTSHALMESIGIGAVLAGDTRFDRVSDVASRASRIPMVEAFVGESWTIVAGSSWPKDEEWLAELKLQLPEGWKLIIAPHEIHETHLRSIEKHFPESMRYSALRLGHAQEEQVLVVDNIGMLSQLYQYGHLALIGGGFGAGIHNVLEAAVFGMPVVFGPNHKRFLEAVELLEFGGGHALTQSTTVPPRVQDWVNDPHARSQAGKAARDYVRNKTGATAQIIAALAK